MGEPKPGAFQLAHLVTSKPLRHPRALISTIEPVDGGVPTMTRWLVSLLDELGIDTAFAWYQPWRSSPHLSVPLHAIWKGRRPGTLFRQVYGEHHGHGIGAWLPELEFTHYLPRRPWRKLISSSDILISVTGNVLSAAPFHRLGLPFIAWVASSWEADRTDRIQTFSLPRRLLDRAVNRPILRHLERSILQSPHARIIALSSYTASTLEAISQRSTVATLRMPVDTALFSPRPERLVPWRIAFTGRYMDPRKHIGLLLKALRILVSDHRPVQLYLIGEPDTSSLLPQLARLGLERYVHCFPRLDRDSLPSYLQTIDVFVIPSHQEGLCIAALEAMACGIPVISTRCGGPEDFVLPKLTGELVNSDPGQMANAITAICGDRRLRMQLSSQARRWVQQNASFELARKTLLTQLHTLYPTLPI